MLNKIDRALHMPLWIFCTLLGMAIDEYQFRKIRRHNRRTYGP